MQPGSGQAPAAATPTARPQVAVPTTRAELEGLVAKRSELENQLESLTERRQELFQQRQRMGREEGRGHDTRIALIDEQTTRIEQDLLALNSAVAEGMTKVPMTSGQAASVAEPSRELVRQVRNGAEDAVVSTMFGSAAGLLAMYVVWRGIRRWIWKKKPAPVPMPNVPDHSPRLEQLQQSMDVIALEVERISEAQRFLAKVMNERVPAIGAGDAQPVSAKNRDAAAERR
jgi:exonuclease VII large subunit